MQIYFFTNRKFEVAYTVKKIKMTAFGRVYTYPNNNRVQMILIAAKYNGLKIDVPSFALGTDNKSEEYLSKFPLGKVPGFEDAHGNTLSESGAIAYYGKF
jgi:elongation factor 1-gamma